MGGFSREHADADIQDDGSDVGSDELGAEVRVDERGADAYRPSLSAGTGRSIMAAFARKSNDGRSRGCELDESVTTTTISSGSVFIPSGSEG
jgi:hypothetical protein